MMTHQLVSSFLAVSLALVRDEPVPAQAIR